MSIKRWFLCKPNENDFFGVRLRKLIQFFGGGCVWEFRADKGEEEHGANIGVRHCKYCNRKQFAFYRPYSDVRIEWRDDGWYE